MWAKGMFESSTALSSSHFVKELSLQRNLHFGMTQLYWKYRSLLACEVLPDGDPSNKPQELAEEANGLIARHRNKAEDIENELWGRPIERYTRQLFKDPCARLAQISSYSEELANAYGLSYVTSLWRESLETDLLWDVDGTPTARPSDYCAPSWS